MEAGDFDLSMISVISVQKVIQFETYESRKQKAPYKKLIQTRLRAVIYDAVENPHCDATKGKAYICP